MQDCKSRDLTFIFDVKKKRAACNLSGKLSENFQKESGSFQKAFRPGFSMNQNLPFFWENPFRYVVIAMLTLGAFWNDLDRIFVESNLALIFWDVHFHFVLSTTLLNGAFWNNRKNTCWIKFVLFFQPGDLFSEIPSIVSIIINNLIRCLLNWSDKKSSLKKVWTVF